MSRSVDLQNLALLWLQNIGGRFQPQLFDCLAENFLRDKGALDPVRSVLATSLIGNAIGKPDFIAFRFEDRACLSNVLCLRLWGIQGVAWTLRSKEDLLAAEAEGLIPIFENFDPEA